MNPFPKGKKQPAPGGSKGKAPAGEFPKKAPPKKVPPVGFKRGGKVC